MISHQVLCQIISQLMTQGVAIHSPGVLQVRILISSKCRQDSQAICPINLFLEICPEPRIWRILACQPKGNQLGTIGGASRMIQILNQAILLVMEDPSLLQIKVREMARMMLLQVVMRVEMTVQVASLASCLSLRVSIITQSIYLKDILIYDML